MTDFEAGFKAAIDTLKAQLKHESALWQDKVAYAICIQHLEEKFDKLISDNNKV